VLQDGLDHGPVLPGQLPGPLAGLGLVDRLGRDPQPVALAADAGADDGPLQAPYHHGTVPAGQLTHVLDLGHGPHPGVVPLQLGDQQ
jgi:hypothetical protein